MATVTGGSAGPAPQLRDQIPKKPCRAMAVVSKAAVKFVLDEDLRKGCGAIAKAINAPWSMWSSRKVGERGKKRGSGAGLGEEGGGR